MTIVDRVYGEHTILEPIIVELISGPTMQRLKGIDQAGYFEPFFPGYSHSRFEHSLGVYLLLHKYGAPLEEQIAGLIHDVSHTTFSHCIDYVFSDSGEKQDFQDTAFPDYVRKSEIPAILKKYGLDIEYILSDEHFPLKENSLPDLCADRIDYSLRTSRVLSDFPKEDVDTILEHLKAKAGKWLFTDATYARKFAELFLFVNTKYFAGIESAVMFQTVSDYLRHALCNSYIQTSDVWKTDQYVLEKIALHHDMDKELMHLFDRMNNKIPYVNDPSNFVGKVVCKARIVDPLIKQADGIVRLSLVDAGWKKTLEEELNNKEYYLRFEK